MTAKPTICELRVVCYDSKEKYPFGVSISSRYFYPTFAEAEAAMQDLILENTTKYWLDIYRYEIYTFECGQQIDKHYDGKNAVDATIYLPDGTRWIGKGEKGVLQVGKIYEYISQNIAGNGVVQLCIVVDDSQTETTCSHIVLRGEFTDEWSLLTDMMPCSLPVSEAYAEALRSKGERRYAIERDEMFPLRGVPYPFETKYEEDMDDYLYVPASFSGFRYDLFFDCNAAYQKNMHPMWLYVAYPIEDKMVLLPVTISSNITLMWKEYEHLMDDLGVTESLIEFVMINLQDIMTLADHQCRPDYFLWNMAKMDTVIKFFSIGEEEKKL